MCYECGENQRNWPFKYCVECYKRTSGSRGRNQGTGVVKIVCCVMWMDNYLKYFVFF